MTAVRSLTVTCLRGLSNRLRVLLSGIALAEASDRDFRMLWPRTRDCAARFDELFAAPPFAGMDLPPGAIVDAPLEQALDLPSWRYREPSRLPDLLADASPHVALEYVAWLAEPERFPHHAPLLVRAADLLAALQPAPALDLRIAQFRAEHFRPVMIGVHLRRGDQRRASPNMVGNTELVLGAVDGFLAEHPAAGIMLATDDGAVDQHTGRVHREGVHARFRQRYGSRVVSTSPRSLDRRTTVAVQDALVDLWLLRSTDYFVGTSSSTFSHLVPFGRKTPAYMCAAPLPVYRRVSRFGEVSGIDRLLHRLGWHYSLAQLWQRLDRLPSRVWAKTTARWLPGLQRRRQLRHWSID